MGERSDFDARSDGDIRPECIYEKIYGKREQHSSVLQQRETKLHDDPKSASSKKIFPSTRRSHLLIGDSKITRKKITMVSNMETFDGNLDPKTFRSAEEAVSPTQSLGQLNSLNDVVKTLEAKLLSFEAVVHERDLLKAQILKEEKRTKEFAHLQQILKNWKSKFEKMKFQVKELTEKLSRQKDIAENALKKLNCASFQLREQDTDLENLLTLLNELYLLNDELKKISSVLSSSKEFFRSSCNVFVKEQTILSNRLKQANLQLFEIMSAKNSILKSEMSLSRVKSVKKCLPNTRCFSAWDLTLEQCTRQESPKSRHGNYFLCKKCKLLSLGEVSHEGSKSFSSDRNESQSSMSKNHAPIIDGLSTVEYSNAVIAKTCHKVRSFAGIKSLSVDRDESFTMDNHALIIADSSASGLSNAVVIEDCHSEGRNVVQLPLKNDDACNLTFSKGGISEYCSFVNGLIAVLQNGDFLSTDWTKFKDSYTSLSKIADNLEGRCLKIAVREQGFALVSAQEFSGRIEDRKSNSTAGLKIGTETLNLHQHFYTLTKEMKEKSDFLQVCRNQVPSSDKRTENIHGLQVTLDKSENVEEDLQTSEKLERCLQKPVNEDFNYKLRSLEEELMNARRIISVLQQERESYSKRDAHFSTHNVPSLRSRSNKEIASTGILNRHKSITEDVSFPNDGVFTEVMKQRKYVSALCKQSTPRESERKLLKYLTRKLADRHMTAFGFERLNISESNSEQLSGFKLSIDASKLSRNLSDLLKKFEKFPALQQIFHRNFSLLSELFTKFEITVETGKPFLNGSVIILNLDNFENNEIPYLLKRILPKKGNTSLKICFMGRVYSYLCSFTSSMVKKRIQETARRSNENKESIISAAESIILDSREKHFEETSAAGVAPVQPPMPLKSLEDLCVANFIEHACPRKPPVTSSFSRNSDESKAISLSLKKPINLPHSEESASHSTDLCNAIRFLPSICSSKKMDTFSSKLALRWKFHPDELIARFNSKVIYDNRLMRPGQKLVSFLHAIILSNSEAMSSGMEGFSRRHNNGPIRNVGIISKSDAFKQFIDRSPVSHLIMFHHILRTIKINLSDRNSFKFINFLLHCVRKSFKAMGSFILDSERQSSCFCSKELCPEEQIDNHDSYDRISNLEDFKPENYCLRNLNKGQAGTLELAVCPELSECEHCFGKFMEKFGVNKSESPNGKKIPENCHYCNNVPFSTDPCCRWYCHSSHLCEDSSSDGLKSAAPSKRSKILGLRNRLLKRNWFVEISILRSKTALLRKQVYLLTDKFSKAQKVRFLSDFEEKLKKLNQLLIEKHQTKSLSSLEEEHEAKIVELKNFYDNKIDNITKRHDEDFKSLCKKYIEKLKGAEEIYDRNIESMEEANISVLKDYKFHYATKVKEWQSMILQYSQNVIDLQSVVSKCEEEYLTELSNIENKFKVLTHELYQCFDKEKVAVYVLLSETMDTFEMSYKKDIEKISEKVDREAAVSHAYFVKEIERCKKKYEHNLRKQKKSYKILLEEGRKSLMRKERRKRMLTFSDVFNFDVLDNEIGPQADPSSVDSLNSIDENQTSSFVYVDEKFYDQLSARKFFCQGDGLQDAIKKLRSNDSFQDFELCELLTLYQEICHTILKHFQIPDSQQLSQRHAPLEEISRSHSITSEMHHLRMRIVQLETILVKSCIKQLKVGENVASVSSKEANICRSPEKLTAD